MTSPTPMSREELLELAALDAFGLLDEYEAALFTRSYHHAPAAVQDEIKQLQAAFAADEALLPAAQPDSQLKQRVLRAVSQAIEAESIELAPLAMIGRSRAREREIVGRLGVGAAGLLWRAAAFTLAGAVLVLAYFVLSASQENDRLQQIVYDLDFQRQIESLAPDFRLFVEDPSCVHIPLTLAQSGDGDGDAGYAVLYVNKETDEAYLLTLNLPKKATYSLTATGGDGAEAFSHSFATLGAVCGVHLELSVVASTLVWQISDSAGTVILTSA